MATHQRGTVIHDCDESNSPTATMNTKENILMQQKKLKVFDFLTSNQNFPYFSLLGRSNISTGIRC